MSKDIMVIDYDKCVRVQRGDESFARPSDPYACPACTREAPTGEIYVDDETGKSRKTNVRYLTRQSLSAKLRFAGDSIPLCENHNPPIEMEKV